MLKISHILLSITYTTSCCHCYYQLLLGTTATTATYHCTIIGLSQEAFPASRQEEALQHLSYAENRFSRGELSFPPLPRTLMPRSSFSRGGIVLSTLSTDKCLLKLSNGQVGNTWFNYSVWGVSPGQKSSRLNHPFDRLLII